MNNKVYRRYENETDEELIYRICDDKDEIGTWEDVKDILNDLLNTNMSESAFRKKYQYFSKMLNANKEKFVDIREQLSDLDDKKEEIRKERIKLQTANIERNRIDRNISRQELFYEYVGSICNELPTPRFKALNFDENKNNKDYILAYGDIHYGAEFESANNKYSKEIAQQRMENLLNDTKELIKDKNITHINVVGLGDDIQGMLRMSDLKINDSSVVKATVEVSKLIASFLNELSTVTLIDFYPVPKSNHSQIRPLGTKANEMADEDLEYIINHYIADLLVLNDRVKVHTPDDNLEYTEIKLFDFDIVAMHGNSIKNAENAIKDLSIMRRSFIDYLIIGHLHCGKEITTSESQYADTEVLVVPSIVGSDPYSDSIFKGSKASAKVFGFDKQYGHTETYKFILN